MLFLVLLVTLGVLLYKYLTLNFGRFRECGVAHEPPVPVVGNLLDVFMGRHSYSENLDRYYRRFQGEKIVGFFNMRTPTFILRDISLINFIFKTEASKVVDRGLYSDTNDPLSMNLFYMEGQLWKKSREKLRPAFKSKNLKNLLPSFERASKDLIDEVMEENESVDVKKHTSRFSTRVITDPVLGLQLSRDEVDTFIHHIEELFLLDGFQGIKVLFRIFWPRMATFLGVRVARKTTEDLFVGLVGKLAENRRVEHFANYINSLREHYAVEEGKDSQFLNGLVVGQFFIFVLAGFETTSTTLTFALYLLAQNPEIYDRMRDEVRSVLRENDQQWNYETLKSLKLVENVILETLRLYPPVTGMLRVASAEINIPDSDIVIRPGEAVAACFTGVHKDPEFFPDPEKFQPDRFDSPIPEGAYLPFGAGPRICIGKDLAMLELKMALSHIVMNFDLEIDTQKTPSKLEVDPKNLFFSVKSGIWIKFKKNSSIK